MGDDEFAFAEPLRPMRPGLVQKAYAWARRGRFARAKEIMLFGAPGALLIWAAYVLNARAWLSDPLSLMLGLCGVLCAGFGLLPPVQRPEPVKTNPKSKRGLR